jgi:hypothetical protein
MLSFLELAAMSKWDRKTQIQRTEEALGYLRSLGGSNELAEASKTFASLIHRYGLLAEEVNDQSWTLSNTVDEDEDEEDLNRDIALYLCREMQWWTDPLREASEVIDKDWDRADLLSTKLHELIKKEKTVELGSSEAKIKAFLREELDENHGKLAPSIVLAAESTKRMIKYSELGLQLLKGNRNPFLQFIEEKLESEKNSPEAPAKP